MKYLIISCALLIYCVSSSAQLISTNSTSWNKDLKIAVLCATDKLCLFHPFYDLALPKCAVTLDPMLDVLMIGPAKHPIFKKHKDYQVFQKKYEKRPELIYTVSKTGELYVFDMFLQLQSKKTLLKKPMLVEKAALKVSDVCLSGEWRTILMVTLVGEEKTTVLLDVSEPTTVMEVLFLQTVAIATIERETNISNIVGHFRGKIAGVLVSGMQSNKPFLQVINIETGHIVQSWNLEKVAIGFKTLLAVDRYSRGEIDSIYAIDQHNIVWVFAVDESTPRRLCHGAFLGSSPIIQHTLQCIHDQTAQGLVLYWRVVSENSHISGVYRIQDPGIERNVSFEENLPEKILSGSYLDHWIRAGSLVALSTKMLTILDLYHPAKMFSQTNIVFADGGVSKIFFEQQSGHHILLSYHHNQRFSLHRFSMNQNRSHRMSWSNHLR